MKTNLDIVTDPIVIKEITRQRLNVDDVTFIQDYGPRIKGVSSPYMKRYQHSSGRQFAVFSGLPMVNHVGKRVNPLWLNTGSQSYKSGDNQFIASVVVEKIEIETINEQPDGKQPGDKVTWNPELWIGNKLIPVSKSRILALDPVNSYYIRNTIEWDYGGICKRRIRIIEGRIREWWIFEVNPKQDIHIKHNLIGSGVKLGTAYDALEHYIPTTVIGDEEIVYTTDLANVEFPIHIGASATYYPDASPETSSVDGDCWAEDLNGDSWANIRGHPGDGAGDTSVAISNMFKDYDADEWTSLLRGIMVFDTSGLADDATVTGATLSIYGRYKQEDWDINAALNVYSSAPATPTAVVAGDYDSLGTTAYCDTPILMDNWDITDYNNNFVFNATGIAAVSKTVATPLGIRFTFDAENSEPAHSGTIYKRNEMQSWSADGGASYKPKLIVTYTTPGNPWWYYQLIRRQ